CDVDLIGKSPELLDHLRATRGPSEFHLATVRDGAGAIAGVVPLREARSGLRFGISARVWWECRLRAVHVLGSLPLPPADPAPHALLFEALDAGFAGCDAVAIPSVPTDSFLWGYVLGSRSLQGRFIPYQVHGVRGCHTVPLPETVEEYRARFSAKKR